MRLGTVAGLALRRLSCTLAVVQEGGGDVLAEGEAPPMGHGEGDELSHVVVEGAGGEDASVTDGDVPPRRAQTDESATVVLGHHHEGPCAPRASPRGLVRVGAVGVDEQLHKRLLSPWPRELQGQLGEGVQPRRTRGGLHQWAPRTGEHGDGCHASRNAHGAAGKEVVQQQRRPGATRLSLHGPSFDQGAGGLGAVSTTLGRALAGLQQRPHH